MNEPPEVETRITDARIGRDFPPPQYATAGAAGMDLRACLDLPLSIAPGETKTVGTGIAISIRHPGYMGLLAPRSGLGVKHGIVLANTVGIIDSDYQDEIRAALFNRGGKVYEIAPGERICQLIFIPVTRAVLKIVEAFSQTTARGAGGFGSTGKF
ncbi:MAG: dUTP diphosphatase [Betaproteobacteria bacterium]|nr:dUTP diphosphatase [Betaproteobacteria bacterium]